MDTLTREDPGHHWEQADKITSEQSKGMRELEQAQTEQFPPHQLTQACEEMAVLFLCRLDIQWGESGRYIRDPG